MGGAEVLMLSAPVVLSSAGWWRVDCGVNIVVLLIETDRRFIIKLTEDIWKVRISFVRTRESYTITITLG